MPPEGANQEPGVPCAQVDLLLENLRDAAWVVEAGGHITHCNRLADRLCGYPRDELTSFHLRHLLASEPEGGLEAFLSRVESGKDPVECAVDLLARNGAHIPVALSFSPLSTTESKRPLTLCVARQTPAGVDPHFKMLAANSREMLLAYDLDRRLIYANPATLRQTGYSLEELEEERLI
jgi:PAS domain S-box-containing protein